MSSPTPFAPCCQLAVNRQPLTAHRPPPTANSQQPTANRQPPTANRSPPTAHRQPPTAHRPLPTAHCQPPTANRQPPTANRQPPTANSQQPTKMPSTKPKPDWLAFDRILLVAFAVITAVINIPNAQRLAGLALFFVFLCMVLSPKTAKRWRVDKQPPEIWLFMIWVLWSYLTGYFVAQVRWFFNQEMIFLVQMAALVFVINGMLQIKGTIRLVFFAYILAALYQGYQANMGLIEIVDDSIAGGPVREQIQASGTGAATNPNALGTLMVTCAFSALLFWHSPVKNRRLLHLLIFALLAFCFNTILISGSRKSLVYFLFFIGGWFVWALPDASGKKGLFIRMGFAGIVGLIAILFLSTFLEGTAAGRRWSQFFERGDGTLISSLEEDGRIWLYREGLHMFRTYPLTGVGMGHYRIHHSRGAVSHSDYIEVLANTGIPGFIIYHSIKFVLLFRLLRLRKKASTREDRYLFTMLTLFVIYYFVYGLGFMIYVSQQMMLRLAAVAGFSYAWERQHAWGRNPAYAPRTHREYGNIATQIPY